MSRSTASDLRTRSHRDCGRPGNAELSRIEQTREPVGPLPAGAALGPEVRVGICVPRSAAMLTCVLGVFKAAALTCRSILRIRKNV